jgi:hypothetical protein
VNRYAAVVVMLTLKGICVVYEDGSVYCEYLDECSQSRSRIFNSVQFHSLSVRV